MSEAYLRGRIIGALGGRAAEELVFGDLTTGAESDLEQVTAIARQMVGRWGMSPAVGPVTVLPEPGEDVGMGTMDPRSPSEATRQLVDSEARAIIDDCHHRAVDILRSNRELLDRLAGELLAHETLDEADAYLAVGLPHPTATSRR
jgi:cell division protease FtsH